MSDIGNRQEPVFLGWDYDSPQVLPLMVTRRTLSSRGLVKDLLDALRDLNTCVASAFPATGDSTSVFQVVDKAMSDGKANDQ